MPTFILLDNIPESITADPKYKLALSKNELAEFFKRESIQSILQSEYSIESIQFFLDSLNRQQALIFHQWIAQNTALRKALCSNLISPFSDSQNILKHVLADEFKAFISPCLYEILSRQSLSEKDSTHLLMSFSSLFSDDYRLAFEQKVFQPLELLLQTFVHKSYSDQSILEKDLLQVVNPEIIQSLNFLSLRSYPINVRYVECLLQSILEKKYPRKIALSIVDQLTLLRLKEEHEAAISDVRHRLKTGQIILPHSINQEKKFNFNSILAPLILVGIILIGISIPFIFQNKFSESQTDAQSFVRLSPAERQEIDSLVNEMTRKVPSPIVHQTPVSTASISAHALISNQSMEEVYNDFYLDYHLRDLVTIECSNDQLELPTRKNSLEINSKKGSTLLKVHNTTGSHLLFFIGKNVADSPYYQAIISPGKVMECKIDKNDILLCVIGKHVQPFQVPKKVDASLLPSFNHTIHFCRFDENELQFMQQSHLVVSDNQNQELTIYRSPSGELELERSAGIEIY